MARKSRGFGELIREKENGTASKKKEIQDPFSEVLNNMVIEPKGADKMSELLKEFVAPYTEPTMDSEEYRDLLSVGIIAWNASLRPFEKQQDVIEQMADESGDDPEEKQEFREFIEELIDRKKRYFADCNQFMINLGDEYRISMDPAVAPKI